MSDDEHAAVISALERKLLTAATRPMRISPRIDDKANASTNVSIINISPVPTAGEPVGVREVVARDVCSDTVEKRTGSLVLTFSLALAVTDVIVAVS